MCCLPYANRTLLPQPTIDLARHSASDCANIEAQFTVRCQKPFLLDNERRRPGVQSPLRVRRARRGRHGDPGEAVALRASTLSLRGRRD